MTFILDLKKVTKDMQTHKNPELRASSVVKDSDVKKPKAGTSAPAAAATKVHHPPKCALASGKWSVVREGEGEKREGEVERERVSNK